MLELDDHGVLPWRADCEVHYHSWRAKSVTLLAERTIASVRLTMRIKLIADDDTIVDQNDRHLYPGRLHGWKRGSERVEVRTEDGESLWKSDKVYESRLRNVSKAAVLTDVRTIVDDFNAWAKEQKLADAFVRRSVRLARDKMVRDREGWQLLVSQTERQIAIADAVLASDDVQTACLANVRQIYRSSFEFATDPQNAPPDPHSERHDPCDPREKVSSSSRRTPGCDA